MKIYEANGLYTKAIANLNQLYQEYSDTGEPNTLTFLLKQKYQLQVNLDWASRDAELTLHNIIGLIDEHLEEYQVLAPHEVLAAHSDLLLHYLNHGSKLLSVSSSKTDKQAEKVSNLLKSRFMAEVVKRGTERVAFAKFLIGIASLTSHQNQVPYA